MESLLIFSSLVSFFSFFSFRNAQFVFASFGVLVLLFQPISVENLSGGFYSDLVSRLMLFLFLLIFLGLLMMNSEVESGVLISVSVLFGILFLLSLDWLSFFIWFEFSVVPVTILLLVKGKTAERLQAGELMLLTTALFSFPLLSMILGELSISSASFLSEPPFSKFWGIFWTFAFLMKIPLFSLHSWLPKAHVEAPLEGSVVLAGILLKFGGVGMWRSLIFLSEFSSFYRSFFVSLALIGSILSAFSAFLSTDMKTVIAFSSVSHMNASVAGFLISKGVSFWSFLSMMVSHGLSSSMLFFLITLNYEKSGSRSLVAMKKSGKVALTFLPFSLFSWSANCSLPPSLGFVSEVLLLLSLGTSSFSLIFLSLVYFFLTSVYSFFMFLLSASVSKNDSVKFSPESFQSMVLSAWWGFPLVFMTMSLGFVFPFS